MHYMWQRLGLSLKQTTVCLYACVWVAGKTVWPDCYTWAISERFRDEGLMYKSLL